MRHGQTISGCTSTRTEKRRTAAKIVTNRFRVPPPQVYQLRLPNPQIMIAMAMKRTRIINYSRNTRVTLTDNQDQSPTLVPTAENAYA
jgi:hypothetical protein